MRRLALLFFVFMSFPVKADPVLPYLGPGEMIKPIETETFPEMVPYHQPFAPTPTPVPTPTMPRTPVIQLGFRPIYFSSTQTLKSLMIPFDVSGFSLFYPSLKIIHHFNLQSSLSVAVSYQRFATGASVIAPFNITQSSASFFSGDALFTQCFKMDEENQLCPRLGLVSDSDFILEFRSNTDLTLSKISSLLVDLGIEYQIALDRAGKQLRFNADYEPALSLGRSTQTTFQSYSVYTLGLELILPVSRNKTWAVFLNSQYEVHQGTFAISQDQWTQKLTAVSGTLGVQWTAPRSKGRP